MRYDFISIENLIEHNVTWRILRADNAPIFFHFLFDAFVAKNRSIAVETDLIRILDNILFYKRQGIATASKNKEARDYLNDWSSSDTRWLNKTWPKDSDVIEPYYDIPPATQRALDFLETIGERKFVGTENNIRLIFSTLNDLYLGIENNTQEVLLDLKQKRDALDKKIKKIEKTGEVEGMESYKIKELYYSLKKTATQILSDFRDVEYNFQDLNRELRQTIAVWDGSKGSLLDQILGSTDIIESSEQGRSVKAFSSFLINEKNRIQFKMMLQKVLSSQELADENTGELDDIYGRFSSGNSRIQHVVSDLSSSIKSFIDNKVFIEQRRIYDLINNIQKTVQEIKDIDENADDYMDFPHITLEIPIAQVNLPFERPLYSVQKEIRFEDNRFEHADEKASETEMQALFEQSYIDRKEIFANINTLLLSYESITLADYIKVYPVQYGLSEILNVIEVAHQSFNVTADKDSTQSLSYLEEVGDEIIEKTIVLSTLHISLKSR
ncbi:DUF3375 domain-containing protein [Anaerobiospirillum thomasii]|uniref:Protein of uncharacterized function (DUF3375) n=1 Tax=Anaerobiospirillum thomasii TaxID=179995 RepID=A0A2X0VCB3_9GAMM|nr:DUF3375 domain-containing protein [Anaerobiospirillum thomasii]SPT70515.1 Protein of uncharacterised function (DUF3375) [Anaerobiospirillum thomasii]